VEEEQIDRVVTKGYRLEEVVRDGEQRAANTAAAVAPAEPEPAVQAPEASAARARAETGPAPAPNPHRPALSTGQPRPSWAGVNPFHGQDAAPESQDDPWAETASRPGAPVPAVLAQEQPLRGVQHDVANGLQQVSASKLRDWTRCRRKWWLTWYRELQLPGNPYGLAAVGTRVHRALAGWYVPDSAGPVPPTDGIELAIKEDWEKIAENLPEDADQREHEYDRWNAAVTLERAMVEGYVQWLEETGADAGLVFTASETELWADISTRAHDGSPLTVRARGKLDARVVREVDGARLFVDHKTVGDLTKPLKTLHMDVQMLHYGLLEWLGTAEGEARCDGALYNMLRRVKRTSSAKPPFYAREDVRHSTVQLEQYRRRMLAAARDMHAAEQRLLAGEDPREVAYPSPGPECAWSCDFFPVCPLFDDGSRADDMLRTVYRADDPWNRYDGLTRKEGTA
jgi:hypothetical protein